MVFEVILKNECSCTGCPLLGVRVWNEEVQCKAGMGMVLFEMNGVHRPRPNKCTEYFMQQNMKVCDYKSI